jgi:hypothetical protein
MKRKMTLAIVAILTSTALAAADRPRLSVEPANAYIDAPLRVVLSHVLPGKRVTLTAAREDIAGRTWTAIGTYFADADGRVDVQSAPSLDGTYHGLSPHGLWCAALPVPMQKLDGYIGELRQHPQLGTAPVLDVAKTYVVRINASIDGMIVASTTARRSYAAGLQTEEVTAAGGLRGVLYLPPAGMPRKIPVVVVAGSGGGVPREQAALLAVHGHPALAQGIFGYEDLPSTLHAIPLETFQAGAKWLERRFGMRRVAIMGTSRGSEAAGLAASYFPDDFAAAVVLVPSHLTNGAFGPGIYDVQPAWTYHGKGLAADRGETDSNNADAKVSAQRPPGFVGRPYYLNTWSDPRIAARLGIPFERMSGPVLAIGAGADQMWPSFIGAVQIGRRLALHGLSKRAHIYVEPGAGHMVARIGTGGPLSSFIFHPVAKDFEATGGLPNGNCEGSYDAWARVVDFLGSISPMGGSADTVSR